jgi:uncharacterized protein (DUF849 family)
MLIQACLNGSRVPGEHPALPGTPEELANKECFHDPTCPNHLWHA